jgi:hypothetical protein
VCATWSASELVAFGTLEQISICSQDGDLLKLIDVRGKPSNIQFGLIKDEQDSHFYSSNAVLVYSSYLFLSSLHPQYYRLF